MYSWIFEYFWIVGVNILTVKYACTLFMASQLTSTCTQYSRSSHIVFSNQEFNFNNEFWPSTAISPQGFKWLRSSYLLRWRNACFLHTLTLKLTTGFTNHIASSHQGSRYDATAPLANEVITVKTPPVLLTKTSSCNSPIHSLILEWSRKKTK